MVFRKKHIALIIWLLVLGLVAALPVAAEEVHGIPVYPGAKPDADATNFLQKSLQMDGFAFRTGDDMAKVVEFYQKQKNLKSFLAEKENAMFRSPDGVDITIQNPFMNMNTGKMVSETLISIVKQR